MIRKIAIITIIFILLPYTLKAENQREDTMPDDKIRNRLIHAMSPYLQAHADNPVDWYEWGEEAFEKARSEDKPIFLSIGYNACHWCHVMEHESFENEQIAAFLNEHYVSIKVDREERPDIDQIYMTAVQALTGGGGWPMTVFLTPDLKPFFGGTYFPPDDRYGRPGFVKVITELAKAWESDQRTEIIKSAQSMVDHMTQITETKVSGRLIDDAVIKSAARQILSTHDSRFGGFGGAPKFPQGNKISLLFRAFTLTGEKPYADAALLTLRKMAEGGMYDQLGGGFHRYSVDERWLVPHFEKMLYDNALLVQPYLEAYQISKDSFFLNIVHGTLRYLQTHMTDKKGGVYSTQDADSEGEEGKYYVWTKPEIERILGGDAAWFCAYYGITDTGNFENSTSILHLGDHSVRAREISGLSEEAFIERLEAARNKLLSVRDQRVSPATDDKILASWNGMAISAFALAYQVTGEQSYLTSARNAADFILAEMIDENILYHSWRQGRVLKTELLEDYAFFIQGLLDLYQASFDEGYLVKARMFTDRAMDQFHSETSFYLTADHAENLIYRPRDMFDGSTPSPASIMIFNLLKLAQITGDEQIRMIGAAALNALSGLASQAPQGVATLILAGHFMLDDPLEVVVAGKSDDKLPVFNRELFSRFIPNKIVVGSINGVESELPLLEGRQNVDELTFYFCRNRTCRLPVTDIAGLTRELDMVTPPL